MSGWHSRLKSHRTTQKGFIMFPSATKLYGFVALTGLLAAAPAAQAQGPAHIHRLTVALERQVRELHREVDAHARPTPQYRHLHREVAEMERLAHHIHEVVDRRLGRAHLREDVRRLDRLVHHVEDILQDLRRSGQTGFQAARHLRVALREVAQTVHHLQHDLD
jgi:hypothetical protein